MPGSFGWSCSSVRDVVGTGSANHSRTSSSCAVHHRSARGSRALYISVRDPADSPYPSRVEFRSGT
jgi:hypothetical protein